MRSDTRNEIERERTMLVSRSKPKWLSRLMPETIQVRDVDGAPAPDAVESPELLREHGDIVLRFPAAVSSGGGDVEARFGGVLAFCLGWPNDEILHAHRLWGRGLSYYAFQEVTASDWIADLEQRNSRHHRHRPGMYLEHRHFIVTFHDETFECIARSLEVAHAKPAAEVARL